MKKTVLFIIILLSVCLAETKAQEARFIPIDKRKLSLNADSIAGENTAPQAEKATSLATKDSVSTSGMCGWTVDLRSGSRTLVDTEKTHLNYHQTTLTDGQGIAMGYLGNLGSPTQNKLFIERNEVSLFPFMDAFQPYYKRPNQQVFLNTKEPYSNISYQTGGGSANKEERFTGVLSSNFGKKFNIGFNFDYVYSRGYYNYLSNKQITYDFNSSYVSDRYQMHAYVVNNNYNNSENGGISDDRYITDPLNAALPNRPTNSNSTDIPTRLDRMWNRLKGRQIFVSNRYNVGYEKTIAEDSITFVPVASAILTTHYTDQQRRFASKDPITGAMSNTDSLYTKNNYTINLLADDQLAYWSLKNTFAITLNEGFKEWVKFGLTAFVEQEFREFALPHTELNFPLFTQREKQNSTLIGGKLAKQQGRILRYNIEADLGVIGYNMGEFRAKGDISTTIRFAGKDAVVRANGYVKNLKPTFFENNYNSKYISWDKDLSDIRRVFVGGEITIPQTQTRLSGGVENIKNLIYYTQTKGLSKASDYSIAQANGDIQIISVRLDQKLQAGIFHWDNQLAYQLSSDKETLALPTLSAYSNLYISTKIAKVLDIQLGVDAHFHTKYYAPGYEPAMMQFYNQQDVKIGGFPISTAYANLNIQNTRIFLMMYNLAESVGNSEYFSLPHYPVNPMIFKMGLSWDFNN